ncbi:hypothetical protein BGL39_04040 [Fructilactobacillus sanfranciscensis]|uniref:hypothetical protein n=1 Tax=Fructilactobacillus sanfranciscensis TaxID=1625 RepID=UPI000CD3EFAF|nr:hypothetical protein [Fructilactobacillus sanfranciscensis]POH09370.1 hypothetical protein BGL37_04130 [Fructilactobacillus sanfranciscensis]POH10242.1 hypothetical protein BGL39_04040 [Fructilactobacillus sanfranciscensis]POH14080.1 hypothetical protein BGL42_04135 [Fructilactobacillus sanfranciscensis]
MAENFELIVINYLNSQVGLSMSKPYLNEYFIQFKDFSNSNSENELERIEYNMNVFLGMVAVLEPEKREKINNYIDEFDEKSMDNTKINKIESYAYDFLEEIISNATYKIFKESSQIFKESSQICELSFFFIKICSTINTMLKIQINY